MLNAQYENLSASFNFGESPFCKCNDFNHPEIIFFVKLHIMPFIYVYTGTHCIDMDFMDNICIDKNAIVMSTSDFNYSIWNLKQK